MSISSRISSMEEHVTNAYNGLQGLGADLNGIDKNIDNIASVLDDIYDDLPKVTGSGTSITLDDTRKGRLESTLSGNTSQFTTTGKNFYSTSMLPVTEYGITISKNANGDIVLNGTPNFSEGYKTFYTGDVITVEAGTYTLSVANKIAGIGCVVGGFNGGCNLTLNDTVTSKSAYADTPQNVNPAINIRYDVGTLTNFVLNPQMEKSSSATTYEPFTNGASPNPDYPQPVNVVSGDNEIVVCGKNLLNIANWVKGRINNTTGNIEYASNVSSMTIEENDIKFIVNQAWNSGIASDFIPISTGTYTFTFSHNREISVYIDTYKNQNERLSRVLSYTDSASPTTRTFTISDSNVKYIRIHFEVNTANVEYIVSDMQLEKGSSASTYEAYQGNTYNIDLPVENLLQCNIVSTTTGGVTITNNNGESFTLQGTATVGIGRDIHGEITLKAGTYTFSADHLPTGVYISLANVSNTILNRATPSRTFTISTDTTYAKCLLWIDSGYTVNDTIKIQLEKGSKQNNFTPYGTTPIELCKIPNTDYEDTFLHDKTTDKWYLHKEIGKVVLNGSEIWAKSSAYSTSTYFAGYTPLINTLIKNNSYNVMCNNFTLGLYISVRDNECIANNGETLNIQILASRLSENTAAALKTWLSTHNTEVYYILATPTNTEITYQPLINQLNLLEQAQSKENQTNISQVNNDLPFIISASALKEWQESTSLNSTLSMVNPLSLGNTLNTQENNTQPIEVDNIEPLEEEENEES